MASPCSPKAISSRPAPPSTRSGPGPRRTAPHLARLYQARLSLHAGNLPEAITRLRGVVDETRADGDAALEFDARVLLGHAAVLAGDVGLARAESAAVRDLIVELDRPADLRDAGMLALAAGDRPLAKATLTRLVQLESDSQTPLLRSARASLEAAIALDERRYRDAIRLADVAAGLRPWYGAALVAARASEAAGDAAGAAARWQAVLNATGQILQDGFPPDIAMARAHVARVQAR